MISGDHLNTAKAVAADAGILTPEESSLQGDHAMDAKDFRREVGNVVMHEIEGEEGCEPTIRYSVEN